MTTEDAIALIYDLKRNRSSGGHESPHKPVLLLALLDLIENGTITANRVEASDALRAAFTY